MSLNDAIAITLAFIVIFVWSTGPDSLTKESPVVYERRPARKWLTARGWAYACFAAAGLVAAAVAWFSMRGK